MFLKIFIFVIFILFLHPAFAQEIRGNTEKKINPAQIYDSLLEDKTNLVNTLEAKPQADDLVLLLPELDELLYSGWQKDGNATLFTPTNENFLENLNFEKAIKQNYKKSDLTVEVSIYKFKDYSSAYSYFTVFHKGLPIKIKLGKKASESEIGISFWKGEYYIDISLLPPDKVSREFAVLASQEISNNIQSENLMPDLSMKLPSLNKVNDSEKYCKSLYCVSNNFLLSIISPEILNFSEVTDATKAEYIQEKSQLNSTLLLFSYKNKTSAEEVFKNLKTFFGKLEENKKSNIVSGEWVLKIKNDKEDLMIIKQKGNLLGIAFNFSDMSSGEKLINLIPWPVEISSLIQM